MVATAAHLVENVIPVIPIRQWVISFPLRIRHYLLDHGMIPQVLDIVVEEIQQRIIAHCPGIPNAKIGAVSFIQNFGSTLNLHPHFHLIVGDGVFYEEDGILWFQEAFLAEDDIQQTEKQIQKRVLRLFGKRGWFSDDEIEKMLAYTNSGFSLNGDVKIHPSDREGLERLIRYCARPSFASENLRWNGKWLIYRLSKPTHKGKTFIQLDPLDFLDRIFTLIPPPKRHRRHYHGVFAPNAPLRKKVINYANRRLDGPPPPAVQLLAKKTRRASLDWAELIARIYEVTPLICTVCGEKIKITAFVTHRAEIGRILRRVGWPVQEHEFDPPYALPDMEICQLIFNTEDGFPVMEVQMHCIMGPDPPWCEDTGPDPPFRDGDSDPPHRVDNSDPPHCDNTVDPDHYEEPYIIYD